MMVTTPHLRGLTPMTEVQLFDDIGDTLPTCDVYIEKMVDLGEIARLIDALTTSPEMSSSLFGPKNIDRDACED